MRAQYFSLVHRHPLVNGNANVLPKGFKALVSEMQRFPSPRGVALLRGLGITQVVVHFDQYPPGERPALRQRLEMDDSELAMRADFGDTAVYGAVPRGDLEGLRGLIPPGASVRLSCNDPSGTGAYMAMLGYVLRDHPLYARLRVDFGQRYVGEPGAGGRYDYVIVYEREDPGTHGLAEAELVWQDGVVRAYRNASPRADREGA